jgi:hypothetical protein
MTPQPIESFYSVKHHRHYQPFITLSQSSTVVLFQKSQRHTQLSKSGYSIISHRLSARPVELFSHISQTLYQSSQVIKSHLTGTLNHTGCVIQSHIIGSQPTMLNNKLTYSVNKRPVMYVVLFTNISETFSASFVQSHSHLKISRRVVQSYPWTFSADKRGYSITSPTHSQPLMERY